LKLSGGVQKKQQEEWELTVTQLKSKLEASEELQIQLAASAAKTRSNNMFSFFVFSPLFYSFLSMFIFSTVVNHLLFLLQKNHL
jgi:hypothetical protein